MLGKIKKYNYSNISELFYEKILGEINKEYERFAI